MTRSIPIWLLSLCCLLILIIAVGGITRLTESGLSIVDWQPLMGVIPPLNQEQWQKSFDDYKNFPEYQKVNLGMTLSKFKKIYFWEYGHRLLGRLLGLVFLLPYLYFLWRKKIPHGFAGKFFLAFLLGGLQGALGWYMVKSGLIDNPDVSHFRLAAHFVLATFILGYLFWLYLRLKNYSREKPPANPQNNSFRMVLRGLFFIFAIQLVYGAFMAGLHAGLVYNTFPKMADAWVPAGLFAMPVFWENLFSNVTAVQFIHRVLGWFLIFGFLFILFYSRQFPLTQKQKGALYLVSVLILSQFFLGVMTLLTRVHIPIAVSHQVLASFVLLGIVNLEFRLSWDRKGIKII